MGTQITDKDRMFVITLLEKQKKRIDAVKPHPDHVDAVAEYRMKIVKLLNKLDRQFRHW